jgi:hypothetical protein
VVTTNHAVKNMEKVDVEYMRETKKAEVSKEEERRGRGMR